MKKIYQRPALLVVKVSQILPITVSQLGLSNNSASLDGNGDYMDVKLNRQNFNVWDDDWSGDE